MSVWEAILYGALQGLTEFLPISSSGHLALFENVFGLDMHPSEQLTFNVFLHVGTLSAVLLYYRRDVLKLLTAAPLLFSGRQKRGRRESDLRVLWMLVCATLPLLPFLLIKDRLAELSVYPALVGVCFLANAVLLFIGDEFGRRDRKIGEMRAKDAVSIGFFQCAALLPGISRSGATVTGALFRGFDRKSAVRFSFLLSIPVIVGAFLTELPEFARTLTADPHLAPYLIGAATAAVTGLLSIRFLEFISDFATYRGFSLYCALAGMVTLLFA